MTSKLAEKLIILGDVCRGLSARIYNLTGNLFKRPSTLNPDVERVLKRLQQKFPEHPADLDKEKGWDIFQKRAAEITSQLQDYYLTFVDAMEFDHSAFELLAELSKTVTFQYDINPDLMGFYMDLFLGYLQLHILISRVPDMKLYLTTYARAYQCANGNTEPEFFRLAHYLNEFEMPLDALRDRCADLSLGVGNMLMSFFPLVLRWNDSKTIATSNMFSVADDANNMDNTKFVKEHLELLQIDRFQQWVLYGFLACPSELHRENALVMLQMCLKSTFVVPVYRDQMLNVHEEYDKMMNDYKLKNPVNNFKLSKHKKIVKESSDPITCVQRHSELRTFLRLELNTLYHFFTEFPQLIAPKYQLVQCALRLLRNEVLWYLQHLDVQPYKAKKYIKPEEYTDPRLSEYIWLIDIFTTLIRQHKNVVEKYYLEALRGPGASSLRPVIDTFVRMNKVSQGVQELLNIIYDTAFNAKLDEDFEAVRLNWYRVSVTINSQQSGIGKNATQLNAAMATIIVHSRHVDRVENQLRTHASLSGLFWYRKVLHQVLMDSLSGTLGQPRHCMALVRIINSGLEHVHRFCPEEQKLLGTKAVATAELFFNAIITALSSLLSGVTLKISSLRAQIAPVEIVHRQQRISQTGKQEPKPGFESIHANRQLVLSIRVWKRSISEICSAMKETSSIVIYNTEFVPQEWLYEAVSKAVRASIMRLALPERAIQRPSILLQQIQDLIYAFNSVDEHALINLKEIVRETFLAELSDPAVGVVGDLLRESDDEKSDRGTILIHAYSTFYQTLLSKNLADYGVTYSELKNGFVSYGEAKLASEQYADLNELKALCTLVGPAGVRVIDRGLLSQMSALIATIKNVLSRNASVLKDMRGHFSERMLWFEKVKSLQQMDELVRAGISLGCILKFRNQLRLALRSASRAQVPPVYHAVELIHNLMPHTPAHDPKLLPMDNLALDIGLDVKEADHPLQLVCKKYKASQIDEDLWDLLPELFAASIARAVQWKEANYLIETQSHTNNIHCLAASIATLISTFKTVQYDSKPPHSLESTKADMERFARCAANSILHMAHPTLKQSFLDYPMASIMVFVQQFVQECEILDLSMLEDFFPFTILRTNYIQMYEQQDAQSTSFAPVADDDEKNQ